VYNNEFIGGGIGLALPVWVRTHRTKRTHNGEVPVRIFTCIISETTERILCIKCGDPFSFYNKSCRISL